MEWIRQYTSSELDRFKSVNLPHQFAEKLRNARDSIIDFYDALSIFGRYKEQRVIALGTAYVEARIQSADLHLPQQRNQLPLFLDAYPEANLSAGGSIPNIVTAFVRLSTDTNARLLCCVGNDDRGRFFTENIDPRLGRPQISDKNPTGVWVGVYNNGLTEDLDFYGAADDATVSRKELRRAKNKLFISDIDFMGTPHTLKQVQEVISAVKRDKGIFALSLGHVGHNPSTSDQKYIREVLSPFYRTPNLVFGNEHELLYVSGENDLYDAMTAAFPETKLAAITRAEKSALIRFSGEIFSVPATFVEPNDIVDVIGAGDAFMGSALAILLRTPYGLWNKDSVTYAMRIASYTASLVVQSTSFQLTPEMAQQVLNYEEVIN